MARLNVKKLSYSTQRVTMEQNSPIKYATTVTATKHAFAFSYPHGMARVLLSPHSF